METATLDVHVQLAIAYDIVKAAVLVTINIPPTLIVIHAIPTAISVLATQHARNAKEELL